MTELIKIIQQEEETVSKGLQQAEIQAEQIRHDAENESKEILAQAENLAEKYRREKIGETESRAAVEDKQSLEEAKSLCQSLRKNSDQKMERAVAYILKEICGIG